LGSDRAGGERSTRPMSLVQLATGTIALHVDLERDRARAVAAALASAVRELGFEVVASDARVADAALLVTVGGDGTLLRAAQIAAPLGIPLLGVNTGRLGFLTEIDGNGDTQGAAAALVALLSDGFFLDRRIGLEARAHGRSYFALNDVVVRRTQPHMA